jgi:hypothetical protein
MELELEGLELLHEEQGLRADRCVNFTCQDHTRCMYWTAVQN